MSEQTGLIALIREAGAACEQHRTEQLTRAGYPGVTGALLPVLWALVDRDTAIGALATGLGIPVQGAAQRVGALEARGYVQRLGHPGDIRQRRVGLTPAGRAAVAADRRLDAELEQRLTAGAGVAASDSAQRVLAALLDMTRNDR